MAMDGIGELLSRVLPRLSKPIQVAGLAIGLVYGLIVHFAAPGNIGALVTAGGVGVSFLIFGQLFSFLSAFPEKDRARVFLVSFAIFCCFTLALAAYSVVLLNSRSAPSMKIGPYEPTSLMFDRSHPISGNENAIGALSWSPSQRRYLMTSRRAMPAVVPIALQNTATQDVPMDVDYEAKGTRNVQYTYSEPGGVPTLRAQFGYLRSSEGGHFPDADFHSDVSWGSPWISIDVANPSKSPLYLSKLKIEASEVSLINQVIIETGEIEIGSKSIDNVPDTTLRLQNLGWGKVGDPTLYVRFGPSFQKGYVHPVTDWKSVKLESFDAYSTVELKPLLPDRSLWKHHGKCDTLVLLGRLKYRDENSKWKEATFSTFISTAYCEAGGNIPPSAVYNVTLPVDMSHYPIFPPISDCVRAGSADKFAMRFTSPRSAHFKLKVTVESTSGVVLQSPLDIDVLVPRIRSVMTWQAETSFVSGCT
jgi:hypothetical protein